MDVEVDIVPLGEVSAQAKRESSEALRAIYDCDVTIQRSHPIPDSAFDPNRNSNGQYRAEDLIELVQDVGTGDKNIGIISEDLYYHRRNFVFGLAYLSGKGSIVSTNRLKTSSDGGTPSKSATARFADRIRKEVVHEIGHTFGLEHCDKQRCVMNFSPGLQGVDIKEENLCGSCSRKIH